MWPRNLIQQKIKFFIRMINKGNIRGNVSIVMFLFLLTSFVSCKKEVVEPDGSTDERSVYLDDEFENKVRDSIWYYYKVVSLWQDLILPKTSSINLIDRRNYLRDNYTQYFETGEDVLEHLMAQTKTSSNGSNYDWYSFIDRKGVISGELQDGITSSYGMRLLF